MIFFLKSRKGAVVQKIVNPPGTPFSLKQIEEGLKASKPVLFFITHGESSTGVVQTLEGKHGVEIDSTDFSSNILNIRLILNYIQFYFFL